MPAPRLNTIEKDVEQFASERSEQLLETQKFKIGMTANGLIAVNRLESMYQVLLSSFHQVDKPEEAKTFIEKISAFRVKLTNYIKKQEQEQPHETIHKTEYQNLVKELDGLIYEFYKIKAELKLSG